MSASAQAGSGGSPASANKTKDLFNAALQARNPNNAYIAHLKIWEEVEGAPAPDNAAAAAATKKARYLILAVQRDTGRVTINKAKRNANGSFSIGKDWDLNTLRQVHVIQPDLFSITLSRSYQWQTQQPIEQQLFLQSLVKVYRKYTQDDGPRLVGIDVPLSSGSAAPTVAESANLSDHPSSGYRTDTSQAVSSNGTAVAAAAPPPAVAPPVINTTAPLKIQRESGASPTRSLPSDAGSANGRDRSGSQSSSTQQSPTKSKREGGLQPSPLSRNVQLPSRPSADSQRSAISDSSTAAPRQTLTASNLAVPRQAPPRKNSADSISIRSGSIGGFSAGGGGGGGDARARLSSIEPIRGGAAYERMLLAGTGLTGVTEVDDDEAGDADQDPYGGAVLADKDAGPDASFSSKRATLGRPAIARLETDKTKLSERSRPSADDVDDDEDENSTLVAVEEMLEGLEWRNASAKGYGIASGKGTADMIEARLLDELSALEAANIFAIIESDDRVALVVKHMEEALADLDMMDSMIAGFKVQLNARADDISHIESQNRGLQVQTSNQRTLMAEIETLINTINVDEGAIHSLSAGRLESSEGVSQLEVAAASLYKSMLQARRDGDGGGADMAAAAERLADHEAISARFCKRVLDYLNVTFSAETQRLLSDPSRQKALQPPHPSLPDHASMEEVLGQYCGLLLYMKEVSSATFSRVSAAYFASASECYRTEMQQLFAAYRKQLRKATDEDVSESSFVAPTSTGVATAAMRSGTIRRAQRDKSIKGARDRGDVAGQDGLQRILSSIFPVLLREQNFISDFLHINDNNITFADYMDLEPYFRRRAAGMFATTSATGPLREMKGAMDLIFGFVAPELQSFTDDALAKDKMCIVGLLATLDRGIIESEEVNCELLQKVLAKLHLRLASQLERFVQEQIKGIEATKLTVKKRKGVVHFMRVFPVFVDRVEQQLVNAETLNIRHAVDGYYVQICGTMFEALQTISRVESAVDDDKGQLNHLVILIENMWYFISEINKLSSRSTIPSASLAGLVKRAQSIYDDSLTSYTGFVLRRSLAKMMDFADGIDALLKNTPATEVSLHSAYSKGAFKKMCKDHTAKDTRKAVEALSKRVGKHFDDDEIAATGSTSGGGAGGEGTAGVAEQEVEVLGRVWGSCEQGYLREFQRVARIGKECYPDVSGATLELGANELRRLFASLAPKRR